MERKQKFSIKKLSVGVVSVYIGFAGATQTVQAEGVVEKPLANQEHVLGVTGPTSSQRTSEKTSESAFKEETTAIGEKTSPVLEKTVEAKDLAEESKSVSEPSDNALNAITTSNDKPRIRRTREVQNEEALDGNTVKEVFEKDGKTDLADDMSETIKSSKRQVRDIGTHKERYQIVLDELKQQNKTNYDSLSSIEKDRISNALVTEFQDHFIENILPGLKIAKTFAEIGRDTNYGRRSPAYIKALGDARRAGAQGTEIVKRAEKAMLDQYNATLTSDPTIEGYVSQNSQTMSHLAKTVLTGQDLERVWQEKESLLRGMYLLNMQYNFEDDLPSQIVQQVEQVLLDNSLRKSKALDNLKRIGNYDNAYKLKTKADYAGLLLHHKRLFETQIKPIIGGDNALKLVEKLAGQMPLDDYVKNRSKALMPESDLSKQDHRNTTDLLHRLNLLLPVLSQGEGAVVGSTRDTVTLGIVDVYPDVPKRTNVGLQPELPQMVKNLNQFENYNTFLRESSLHGPDKTFKTAAPLIARDSLMTGKFVNGQEQRVWQTQATNATVRNLIAPLKFDSSSYRVGSGIEGEQASQDLFNSFTIPLLDGSSRGPGLYSHEMTHANDREVLFDKQYGQGGRRDGQGPEVYARGLFEARDNTQTSAPGNVYPVFNLNTTIVPTDGRSSAMLKQVQPLEALDTPEKLVNYQKKLMKLIMWMEAKEADIALRILSDEDKKNYFNQVTQQDREEGNSTDDVFIPSQKAPRNLEDLVNGSYVSAGFIKSGIDRLGKVKTNGYDFLPLFDSFYGANYAPVGKNTVGDLSFKRNAHELLAYQGYDAMIAYLSDQFSSDQEFYNHLKTKHSDKENALAGQTQASGKATKIKQYQELLELELQNIPEEIKNLYTPEKLEQAIRADLQVLKTQFPSGTSELVKQSTITNNLKNVRELKLNFFSRIIEETDTMTSDPNKQNLFNTLYSTKYIYEDDKGGALNLPELALPQEIVKAPSKSQPPVAPQSPITVGNQTYTFVNWEILKEDTSNPLETITTYKGIWRVTSNQPKTFDIIYVSGTGRGNGETVGNPINNLKDAILKVRDGGTIRLVGDYSSRNVGSLTVDKALTIDSQTSSSLNLNESLTFNKPVTLTGNLQIFSVGNGGQSVPLIFNDDVIIEQGIRTHNHNGTGSKPTVVLNAANATIKGGEFEKLVTSGSSTATISDSAKLSQGVETNGKVTITYATNQTNRFKAISGELNLIFSGNPANLTLENVKDVTLLPKAAVSLAPNASISGHVSLHNDAILRVQDNDLTFSKLTGPGTLSFDEAHTLRVSALLSNPTIEIISQTGRYQDNKTYVYAESGDATVIAKQLDEPLEKTPQNDYRYLEPYHIYHEFKASEAKNDPLFRADDFRHLLPENDGDISLTEPKTPVLITETVVSNNKKWIFKKWLLKKEHNGKSYVFFGLWEPQDLVAPKESRQITYEFEIRGATEERFRSENIVKPGEQLVLDGEKVSPPTTFDNQVRASQDQSGEWQFKGWNPPGEQLVSGPLTFIGTWEFMPYKTVDFSITYEADPEREAGTDNVIKIPGVPGKQSAITDKIVVPPTRQVVTVGTKPKVEVKEADTIPVTYVRNDAKEANIKTQVNQGRPEKTTIRTTFDIVDGKAVPKITETTEEAIPKTISVGTKPLVTEEISKIRLKFVANEQDPAGHMVITDVGSQTRTKVTTPYKLVNGTAVLDEVNKQTIVYEGSPRIVTVGTKPVTTQISQDLAEKVIENPNVLAGTPDKVTPGRPKLTEIRKTYTLNKDTGKVVEKVEEVIVDAGLAPERIVGTKAMVINPIKPIRQPKNYQISYRYNFENGQETNFDVQKAPLPSGKTVAENETISVPNLYTDIVIESKDATGEWKFKGWNPANEQVVSGPLTFTGTWEYKAYSTVEPSIRYEANDQLAFASQPVTILGQSGKASAFTGRLVEKPTDTVVQVGTKPTVEIKISDTIPVTYIRDDANEVNVRTQIHQGSPEKTIVKTTYKIVDGKAVAQAPTSTVEPADPTIISIGTKPVTTQISQDLAEKIIEDPNILAGTPDKVTPGRPKLTEIRKTYTLNKDTGKVVEKVEEVIVDAGLAPERIVGTKAMVISPIKPIRQPKNYQISYRYSFENGQETNFDVQKAPLPSGKTVAENETISVPNLYTDVVIESKDATGEWKFKGWNPANEQVVSGPLTFTGTWEYKAYSIVEPSIRYEANDQLAFASHPVTMLGQSGKASAFTGRLVEKPTDTVVQVGTKPTVEIKISDTIPVTYIRDDAKEANVRTQIHQGSPEKTIVKTTYKIVDGKAVAQAPTSTVELADPTVISIGTKPSIQEIKEKDIPISYIADVTKEPNKKTTKKIGSPAITTIKTTYRLIDDKAVDNTPEVSFVPAIPTEIAIGVQPTIVLQEEILPEVVEYDSFTLVGSADKVIPGKPKISEIKTTYILNKETGNLTSHSQRVVINNGVALRRIIASKPLVVSPPIVSKIPKFQWIDDTYVNSVDRLAEKYQIKIVVDEKVDEILYVDVMTYNTLLNHIANLIASKLSENLNYISSVYSDNTVILKFITNQSTDISKKLDMTVLPIAINKTKMEENDKLNSHQTQEFGQMSTYVFSNNRESNLNQTELPKTGDSNREFYSIVYGIIMINATVIVIVLNRRKH